MNPEGCPIREILEELTELHLDYFGNIFYPPTSAEVRVIQTILGLWLENPATRQNLLPIVDNLTSPYCDPIEIKDLKYPLLEPFFQQINDAFKDCHKGRCPNQTTCPFQHTAENEVNNPPPYSFKTPNL